MSRRKKKTRNIVLIIIKFIFSLLFLLILFKKIDLNELLRIYISANLVYFILAALISLLNVSIIGAYRWKILLLKKSNMIEFKNLARLSIIARSLNTLIPGNFMGDIIRGLKFSKIGITKGFSMASVLMDRFIALVSFIFLSFFGFVLNFKILHSSELLKYYVIVVALSIIIMILLLRSNIFLFYSKKLKEASLIFLNYVAVIFESLSLYKDKINIVLRSLLVSVISGLLTVSIFFLLGKALSLSISFYFFILVVPLITVVSMVPVTVGGLGIREYASVLLFSLTGISKIEALSISLMFFVIMLIDSIIGLLFYFSMEYQILHTHHQK